MAFPDSDLPLLWEAAFGADPEASPGTWTFTSLTSRHLDSLVNLKVGRRADSLTAEPSAVAAVFDNDNGVLTPLRAMSPYWPNIKLDTPFRCALRRADDTFTRTVSNGWGTSDSGHAWTTSGGVAGDYSTTGTAASVSVSATGSDRMTLVDLDGRNQDVRITATTNATPSGGTIDTGVVARYSDASNHYIGAATVSTGGVVTAAIAKRVAGVLTTVTSVSTGLSTATSKRLRFRVAGNRLQLKVWLTSSSEPDTWTLDVFDDSLTAGNLAGSYSRRNTGNTTPTTFTYDTFDTTHVLLEGFTDSWKPDFIPTTDGGTSVVRVTASGPLRRLGQGHKPLRSPLFRSVSGVAAGDYRPYQYWPMEDGDDAAFISSGVAGGAVIPIVAGVTMGAQTGLPGSEPLPDLAAGAQLLAPIPDYTDTGQWVVEFLHRVGTAPGSRVDLMEITIAGGYFAKIVFWLDMSFGGDTWLDLYLPDGSIYGTYGPGSENFETYFGFWRMVAISARNVGGDMHIGFVHADGMGFTSTLSTITVVTGGTAGKITSVRLLGAANLSFGHLAVYTDPSFNPLVDTAANSAAMYGYVGEQAQDRIARLCREHSIPFSGLPGFASAAMGAQLTDTLLANIEDCEHTDQGFLGEEHFGLTYIPRSARYRRPVGITIDLATYNTASGTSRQVLSPIYDDRRFRNEWTVSRPDGATVIGSDFSQVKLVYDDQAQPNLESDAQLIQDMSWRLANSSQDRLHWGAAPVDLSANPDMIGEWLGATPGLTRVVRTGLPARAPDGDIDELLDGIEHQIRRRKWTLVYAASPAKVYNEVGVWGSSTAGSRYDSAHSTLAASYDADDTSFSVATTAGHALWRTGSGSPAFPTYINVAGIRIKVTAIAGTSSPQTFTVERSVDGYDKALSSGAQVRLWNPARWAL